MLNGLLIGGWLLGVFVLWRRRRSVLLLFICIVGGALLATSAQFILFDFFFSGRTYVYLLVPLVILAANGLARVPYSVWAVPVVLVLLMPPLQADLGRQTRIDYFLGLIDDHAEPGDSLIMTCCLFEQVWYELGQRDERDRLLLTPATERIFLFDTPGTDLDEIIEQYSLGPFIDNCRPVDADSPWQPNAQYDWQAYECDLTP